MGQGKAGIKVTQLASVISLWAREYGEVIPITEGVQTFSELVDPGRPFPPKMQRTFTPQALSEASPFSSVYERWVTWVNNTRAIAGPDHEMLFVAHGGRTSDIPQIKRELARITEPLPPCAIESELDTVGLFRRVEPTRRLGKHTLACVHSRLRGRGVPDHHAALSDARALTDCLLELPKIDEDEWISCIRPVKFT